MQVGRQFRGAVQLGDVAVRRVVFDGSGDEIAQAFFRPGTRGLPAGAHFGVPLDLRQELEGFDGQGRQGLLGRSEFLGGRQRGAELQVREAVLPERREDLERVAGEGLDLVRFVQEVPVEGLGLQPGVAQRGFHLRVALDDERLVPSVPRHEVGAGLRDEFLQHGEAFTGADHERRTCLGQLFRQIRQRKVQPPVRSRAGLPGALRRRVVDEDRNHRATMLDRRL